MSEFPEGLLAKGKEIFVQSKEGEKNNKSPGDAQRRGKMTVHPF